MGPEASRYSLWQGVEASGCGGRSVRACTPLIVEGIVQGLEDPEAVGQDYNVEEADDGPRPFTALLDTGLKRTSTGSKVFAALKVRCGGSPRRRREIRLQPQLRSQLVHKYTP